MNTLARIGRWWRQAGPGPRAAAVVSVGAVAGLIALLAIAGGGRSPQLAARSVPPPPATVATPVAGKGHGARAPHASAAQRHTRRRGAAGPATTPHHAQRTPASVPAAHTPPGSTAAAILALLGGSAVPRSEPAGLRQRPAAGSRRVPVASAATQTPVAVEFDYQDGAAANSFFSQYGVQAEAADPAAEAQATATWINQHGGLLGHRLVLRMRHFDFYRDQLSVLDQATCADAAAAPGVLADVDSHASTDVLIPCLAKHGIPTIVDTSTEPALGDFAHWPGLLFSPGSAAVDRPQQAFVSALKGAGFFQGGNVGILEAEGLPQFDAATSALKRALAAAGVQPVADAVVSTEDPASFFSSEANAELRFRLADVQRVVLFDFNGVVAGQFMRVAAAQAYHPQFGLTSMASPEFLAAQAPSSELQGAIAMGWSPLVDVSAADDPTGGNVIRGVCDQAFSAGHVATGGRTPFGQYTAYQSCSDLLAIKAAVTVSGAVTSAGLSAGLRRVGSLFTSPLALSSGLAARTDGATGWRLARYQDGCACFQYSGSLNSF